MRNCVLILPLTLAFLTACSSDVSPAPVASQPPASVSATSPAVSQPPDGAALPGDQLIFIRGRELIVLDIASGRETATGITDLAPIALTEDGAAVIARQPKADDIHTEALVRQPLAGGGARTLIESMPIASVGVPSPDGRTIVFSSDGAVPNGLVLVDLATGEARQATTDGGRSAVWSPDGSRIAYEAGNPQTGQLDLHMLDLGTGLTRRLTDDEWEDTPFRWADDGGSILTTSHRGGDGSRLAIQFWEVNALTGALAQREEMPVVEWALRSPDGRMTARLSEQLTLLITQGDRRIGERVGPSDTSVHLTWSPNSAWLVYTQPEEPGNADLWIIHAPDGEPTRLTRTPESESHPVWGPARHGF